MKITSTCRLRSLLRSGLRGLILTALVASQPAAHADSNAVHDLVLFTSADVQSNWNIEGDEIDDLNSVVSADLLYSYSRDSIRVLVEYLVSTEELDLERLMLGWQRTENSRLWLGRMHQPAKYWTTEYHHGQFLQTSISRPGIEEWEDEGGPIGSHVTGVLWQQDFPRADGSNFELMLSAGLGPRFVSDELEPYDLFDPGNHHGPAVSFRIAFWPHRFGASQFGIVGGFSDIDTAEDSRPGLEGITDIKQRTLGVFGDIHWRAWRFIAAATHFNHHLESPTGTITDTFQSTYVQLEYTLNPHWTFFGRTEFGTNEDDSLFLSFLPEFIAHRTIGGVRWDLLDRHSLTLELSDSERQGEDFRHEDFNQLRLQWSAAIP